MPETIVHKPNSPLPYLCTDPCRCFHAQVCNWPNTESTITRPCSVDTIVELAHLVEALFSLCRGDHWVAIESSLESGCALSHESPQDGCNGTCVKLEASKPT